MAALPLMPQTQVCPPSLHISLGIFHRLFTLLEQECHDLDLLLAKREDVHLQPGTEFENYYTIRKQIRSLEQQVTSHHQQAIALDQVASLFALTLRQPEQNPQLQSVRQEAIRFSHQESQIRVLGKEDFSVGSGPFVQALDKALKTFNVERQAYYSGTFIGNHVHRTLKVMNKK